VNKEMAYRIVGEHVYMARLKYEGDRTIVVLADTMTEATEKAQQFFGLSSVVVERVWKTYDPQVYVAWGCEKWG
jgi:hypothetical protein